MSTTPPPTNVPPRADERICNCMQVNRSVLQAAIDAGAKTFEALRTATTACTVCGSCRAQLLEMLGINGWVHAMMEKSLEYNDHVYSYLIFPDKPEFLNFKPGQYIILQSKKDDYWISRRYSIAECNADGALRIIIEKENGAMSQWLFHEAAEMLNVTISLPQGNFILNEDKAIPAMCFAGGIGLVPFLSYIRKLIETTSTKPISILYYALKENEFIFKEELTSLMQKLPSLTINYFDPSKEGVLTENKLNELMQTLKNPEIYICGPREFKELICSLLTKSNVDKTTLHIEEFIEDSSTP